MTESVFVHFTHLRARVGGCRPRTPASRCARLSCGGLAAASTERGNFFDSVSFCALHSPPRDSRLPVTVRFTHLRAIVGFPSRSRTPASRCARLSCGGLAAASTERGKLFDSVSFCALHSPPRDSRLPVTVAGASTAAVAAAKGAIVSDGLPVTAAGASAAAVAAAKSAIVSDCHPVTVAGASAAAVAAVKGTIVGEQDCLLFAGPKPSLRRLASRQTRPSSKSSERRTTP